MAACKNVETYCAAQIFYTIGYQGISFTIVIFIADTCSLKDRALTLGLTGTPTIATVWAAGPAAQSIIRIVGIPWGFGIWCIVNPIVCAPWFIFLVYFQRQAKKQELVSTNTALRTPLKSFLYFLKEIDAIGLTILATGFSLFLLAFNLYTYQQHQWESAMTICFIVFGSLLAISFPVYERYLTPKPFIPWSILKNRTITFVFAVDLLYYASEQTWGSFFYSVLIVFYDQSITDATYISNIYYVGSAIWLVVMGLALRKYGQLRLYAIFIGIPFTLLGTALLIRFPTSSDDIRYVVMCQIFIAVGGGTMYVIEQLAITAASTHETLPSVLAVLGIVAQVGKAVGGTIGNAIWTGVFPKKLEKYLPSSALPYLPQIYGSIYVQTSFSPGSPERDAINHSYADTTRLILITSTCLLPPCLLGVALWSDYDVKNIIEPRWRLYPSRG